MMQVNKNTLKISSSILFLVLMTTSFAETQYRVKSTDNLNRIIGRHYQQSDFTRSQLLVGVLAKNPKAFRGGNINFLLRDKQLILPDESDIETLSDDEAKELLSKHVGYFRRGETGGFGSPLASGYLVSRGQKKTNAIEDKQVLQTVKIDQLEKESENLRKRLEKLISEKSESDAKLRKVEEDLQNTFNKTSKSEGGAETQGSEAEQDKKKLNEQVKEKIDGFQSINAQKTDALNPLKDGLPAQVDNSSNILSSNNVKEETTNFSISDNQQNTLGVSDKEVGIGSIKTILEQYYLPILVFLLFILAWLFWSKDKKNRLIAKEVNIQSEVEQTYLEDVDFLNQQPEEAPSKNTVKIDMAKAYIDAGDTNSATDILNRLINEGNSAQRERAQNLLNTL